MNTPAKVYQLPVNKQEAPRVNSWRWNEIEDDALDHLPMECQIIYMRVIRKHMDYSTGITGRARRISYAQMKEAISYVPPLHSREKEVGYSTDQIKRLVQKLVDAGLIERLHDTSKGVSPMVFRLPLASSDVEEHRHESATATPPREKPHDNWAESNNTATRSPRKIDEHRHPSGSGNNSSLRSELSNGASPQKRTKSKPEYSPEFETAWSKYPKRSGSNPKPAAFKSWRARLAEGVDISVMIAGIERYAAFVTAKGNQNTEYVMQAQRFFGTNREFENDWTITQQTHKPRSTPGMHTNLPDFSNVKTREDGTVDF